jgi:3',5'-cyclic AMP phosphodiesterase CpdA
MVGIRTLAEKLRIVSDAEVLVLAGDIGCIASDISTQHLNAFLKIVSRDYKTLLYVPGNHEYYNSVRAKTNRSKQSGDDYKVELFSILSAYDNLIILDNATAVIEDKVFAGTTLWWDTTHPFSNARSSMLNDFTCIPGGIDWIHQESQKALDFIHGLSIDKREIDCLITHHGVTTKVHENWIGNLSNIYFYHDISHYLSDIYVKYIIHGHQHDNDEYLIPVKDDKFATVTRNALGYPRNTGADSKDFDYGAVIDL